MKKSHSFLYITKTLTTKNSMRNWLLFIALSAFSTAKIAAQDAVFSQFYASPLQLNPAFAGNAISPFIALNCRVQWPSLVEGSQGLTTYAASYDQFLPNLNSGIGISIMSDNAANIYRRTSAALTYAYRVRVNEDITAKIGVQAGLIQNFLDWDKLIFPDQLDPIRGASNPTAETRPLQTSNMAFDISTGVLLYAENFHIGMTGQHLSSPNESFINLNNGLRVGLPIRWSVHGGYHHTIRKGNRMHPEVFIAPTLLLTKQTNLWQVNGGAYMGFGPIFGGLWFRHTFGNPDAVITVLGFQQPHFKVGYSYDYTISQGLAGRSGGTHEISLIFNLDPSAAKRKDLTNCLKMFR